MSGQGNGSGYRSCCDGWKFAMRSVLKKQKKKEKRKKREKNRIDTAVDGWHAIAENAGRDRTQIAYIGV